MGLAGIVIVLIFNTDITYRLSMPKIEYRSHFNLQSCIYVISHPWDEIFGYGLTEVMPYLALVGEVNDVFSKFEA